MSGFVPWVGYNQVPISRGCPLSKKIEVTEPSLDGDPKEFNVCLCLRPSQQRDLGEVTSPLWISPSIKLQVLGDSLVSSSYNFMIIPVPCDWSRYEAYSGWRKQQHNPPHIPSPCLEGAYILCEDVEEEEG